MSDQPVPRPNATSSLLALLLIAPVPTIGVAAAMVAASGPLGNVVFTVAKLWLVGFPAIWYMVVERGTPSLSPPREGGLLAGAVIGLAMALAIAVCYTAVLAGRIDSATARTAAATMELADMTNYLLAAVGWILVNSVVEEYVYRWFMLRQLRVVMPDTWAVFSSAAIFTVHHVVAMSVYLDPWTTTIASTGVFSAGAIWCWLYLRYRSIWPGWISHAIADVAVFAIGGFLLFG
jgi:membrane protease YdiL (CAAX protease family)